MVTYPYAFLLPLERDSEVLIPPTLSFSSVDELPVVFWISCNAADVLQPGSPNYVRADSPTE